MKTTNKATMVCMMSGFHPGVVQVDWLADGNVITEGVETAKPSKQNDKYVASSYLTVNKSDWERHQTFSCKVTHEGNPITKLGFHPVDSFQFKMEVEPSRGNAPAHAHVTSGLVILRSSRGQPVVPPTVHVFPPSAEEMRTTNKATMVCMMSGFHPGVVQVDWLADGNVITEGVETAKPSKQNDKYVASSYLTLNNSDWERHQTFSCKVTHEGNPITKSVDRSECP
uniref:Uncharacterized protein n=1 Tax=Sphaerodactylus townsendi TaxID=933632 RepID=A0ACB8FYW3_9SAUR